MYASDWIFGLFASVIPLEKMSAFFSKFYQFKWIFFYKLILSILKFLEKELLQEDELWNILNQIKSQTHLNTAAISGQSSAVKNSKKKKSKQRNALENSQNYDEDSRYRQRDGDSNSNSNGLNLNTDEDSGDEE